MKSKIGTNRVKARIKFVVADFLQHRLADPRKGFMTVTKVDLTPDFRYCKIYVSVLGTPGEQSKTMHMLADARGLIQRKVAKSLSTRVTPELTFIHDQSIEKSIRLDSIFDQIAAERAESTPDTETDEDAESDEDVSEQAADSSAEPESVDSDKDSETETR
ncbi:MAG: 30S ribosome-binding factor RbfA [Planctomycetota bacterium]|nr:30S ribosome-binding factor RbfA [Planctomycetota bacterium]